MTFWADMSPMRTKMPETELRAQRITHWQKSSLNEDEHYCNIFTLKKTTHFSKFELNSFRVEAIVTI